MRMILVLTLLLAGCAKKPAPTPQHTEIAPDGWKTTKGGVDMRDGERLVDAMQMALIREGARLDRAKQDTEIAVLKRRVAELEKRCPPPATYGPSGAVFQEEPK